MAPSSQATPAEFGAGLKHAREASGVALETIASRTKISLRALSALEAGEFGKLPDRTFARMFLRQYLGVVGVPPNDWVVALEGAWRRFEDASQPGFAVPAMPVRRRHVGPWVIGMLLVAAGVVGVLLVSEGPSPRPPSVEAPLPTAVAMAAAPAPAPVPPPSPTPVGPAPDVLVVRTAASPCWVEVRVAGEQPTSRLLAASSTWEVPAGGKEVDLVLGDAGAATVEYLGEVRRPGTPGAVARVHLDGGPSPAPRK